MPVRKMKLPDSKKPQQIIAAHNIISLGGDKPGISIDTSKKIKIKRTVAENKEKEPKSVRNGTFYGLDINLLESIDVGIT